MHKRSVPRRVFIGSGGNMCGPCSVFQLQCDGMGIALEPEGKFASWFLGV